MENNNFFIPLHIGFMFVLCATFFNFHDSFGMKLTSAKKCSIERINPQGQTANSVIELTQCIEGENSIVYEIHDGAQTIHYLFTINDANALVRENADEVVCSINDESNSFIVKFTLTENDKKTIEATINKQEKDHWKKNIRCKNTEVSISGNKYILQFDELVKDPKGNHKKDKDVPQRVPLSENAVNSLQYLTSNVIFNAPDEMQTLTFTFQPTANAIPRAMTMQLDQTTAQKFPRPLETTSSKEQAPAEKKPATCEELNALKRSHVTPIIELIDAMLEIKNSDLYKNSKEIDAYKNDIGYKNNMVSLHKRILRTITTLNPHFFQQLKIEEGKSIEFLEECNKSNDDLKKFHKLIQKEIHPDKNKTRKNLFTDVTTSLEPIFRLKKQTAKIKNLHKKENKAFAFTCLQQHVVPSVINAIGTLVGPGLAFWLSDRSQQIQQQNISLLTLDIKKTKEETENLILATQNKLNRYLKKNPTIEDLTRFSKILERYS